LASNVQVGDGSTTVWGERASTLTAAKIDAARLMAGSASLSTARIKVFDGVVCGGVSAVGHVKDDVKKADLRDDEEALLELLSIRPVGFLPPIHEVMAEGLKRRGFVSQTRDGWHATTSGQLMLRWGTQARSVRH
jgi:hypothetical protein